MKITKKAAQITVTGTPGAAPIHNVGLRPQWQHHLGSPPPRWRVGWANWNWLWDWISLHCWGKSSHGFWYQTSYLGVVSLSPTTESSLEIGLMHCTIGILAIPRLQASQLVFNQEIKGLLLTDFEFQENCCWSHVLLTVINAYTGNVEDAFYFFGWCLCPLTV